MKDLNEILEEWDKDSNIDDSMLTEESSKISRLHHKYHKALSVRRMRLLKMRSDLKQLKAIREDYYLGLLNNNEDLKKYNLEPFKEKLNRTQVERRIDQDSDLIKANLRISIVEEEVDLLLDIMKSIQSRNWTIRNMIEWTKFINGAN
jgi:hypothetical protein